MLISLQKKLVFLAMAKTGSTAIEQEVAPYCDIIFTGDPRIKHMQVKKFDRFIRPFLGSVKCKDLEIVCLFREPIEWLGSWYRYRSRPSLNGNKNSTKGISFEDFVVAYMSNDPKPFAKVGQQSNFVRRKNGEIGIDTMFRYDQFPLFEAYISDRFSQKFDFKTVNASPLSKLDLSDDTSRKVSDFLATDYEIYESIKR